jgi:hypothetical protein
MTKELGYFPPNGTKWKWEPKTLNYSPWICCLSRQREPKLFMYPFDIKLIVDLINTHFHWVIELIDFQGNYSIISGISEDPLQACLTAEEIGECKMDELLPDWIRTALENKWRPPASSKYI